MKKSMKRLVPVFICLIFCGVFLFPFLFTVSASLKQPSDVISTQPRLFPDPVSIQNYRDMFEYLAFGKYLTNSLIAASVSTVISLSLGSLAAYGLSRFRSRLSSFFMYLTLMIRMIPLVCISVPIYSMINKVGLRDTHIALIFVYACIGIPFVIWMMMGFFNGIPKELDEAALVDGCSSFGAFFRVVLPVSVNGMATTAIFTFLTGLNDFLFALLITMSGTKTVPVGLSEFLTEYNLQLGPMAAGAVLFSLPIILISFVIQKSIVKGMTMGAVKG